jgi:hypothetical protein
MRYVVRASLAVLLVGLLVASAAGDAGDIMWSFASQDGWVAGLAWDGTYIWEAGRSTATVYQVDPMTGAIVSSFGVTGTPRGITFDGTHLWMSNSATSSIEQYTTTGALVSSFPTAGGSSTRGMAWDGTYLYNTDNGGGNIYVYTTTGTLITSYTTAALYPYGIGWDYMGPTYMWCADPGGGNYGDGPDIIWQLDAAGNAVSSFDAPGVAFADSEAYPAGLTVVPPYIYVSDVFTDSVYVVDPGVPVPVELASFAGHQQGSSVVLSWTTRTEINNLGFRVYRSTLADLGFREMTGSIIPGAGTTSEPQDYCYVDPRVPPGTYYYQLEDVSLGGETQRHGPVVVSVAATGLVASVENPAVGGATVSYALAEGAGRASVSIYDVGGRLVQRLASGRHGQGSYTVRWDGTDESGAATGQGVYLVRVEAGEATLSLPFVLAR